MQTEQQDQQGLLKKPKDTRDIHDFTFLVEDRIKTGNDDLPVFRHEILGLPLVPFLGKYAGAGYEFGQVLSVVSTDIAYEKKDNEYQWVIGSQKRNEVNLPEEVGSLLLHIPAFIEENKKEGQENEGKGKAKGGKGKPDGKNQSKLTQFYKEKDSHEERKSEDKPEQADQREENFKVKKEEAKQQPNNGAPRKQAAFIATEKVKFTWVIQLNNIEVSAKLKNEPTLIVNYVMHTVLFPYISFERAKAMTARTPVGLIVPKELKGECGVREFFDSAQSQGKFYSGLKTGNLRVEYSSVHLKGESLCFSPNNMKVVIDKKVPIGLFWTIALDETMLSNSCYLHWIINDTLLFGPIENICREAKCMEDIFRELESLLGKENIVLGYTEKVFKAKEVYGKVKIDGEDHSNNKDL